MKLTNEELKVIVQRMCKGIVKPIGQEEIAVNLGEALQEVVDDYQKITGQTSDGHHTFDELSAPQDHVPSFSQRHRMAARAWAHYREEALLPVHRDMPAWFEAGFTYGLKERR